MKIVSIKQVLHWLFLVVGIISVITLAVSVNSYIAYAKEGYGLEVGDLSANIIVDHGYWLRLRFNITNPGKLDMELEDPVLFLNGTAYYASNNPLGFPQNINPAVPKQETEPVILWFDIDQEDHDLIASSGLAEILLRMKVFVPERHVNTSLIFESVVEVVP